METVVLKLGGALLTDKSKPFALRYTVIKRVSMEIAEAYKRCRSRLVIVHGGGSFGHYVVREHSDIGSREAISQIVWFMRELNTIIVDALMMCGVPAIPMDTHALISVRGSELHMHLEPIAHALELGLVPVIYGNVVLGEVVRIVSGDELTWYLGREFRPSRLLFATTVDGIYDRDPSDPNAKLLEFVRLSDAEFLSFSQGQGLDVTGGMKLKISLGLKYASKDIKEVLIFNGLREGAILSAICGQGIRGTRVVIQ